jgi:hypothetical protein
MRLNGLLQRAGRLYGKTTEGRRHYIAELGEMRGAPSDT